MKHIDKYNKFIKLNEDTEIVGDIDEYDTNLIKDGLIELVDLGWKIDLIDQYKDSYHARLNIETKKITNNIYYVCDFDKNKFYEVVSIDYDDELFEHELNDYEINIINTAKERSQLILNMLEYDGGSIKITELLEYDFVMSINLYKN